MVEGAKADENTRIYSSILRDTNRGRAFFELKERLYSASFVLHKYGLAIHSSFKGIDTVYCRSNREERVWSCTVNNALVYAHTAGTLSVTKTRLVAQFNVAVRYRSGRSNQNADSLSINTLHVEEQKSCECTCVDRCVFGHSGCQGTACGRAEIVRVYLC